MEPLDMEPMDVATPAHFTMGHRDSMMLAEDITALASQVSMEGAAPINEVHVSVYAMPDGRRGMGGTRRAGGAPVAPSCRSCCGRLSVLLDGYVCGYSSALPRGGQTKPPVAR